MPQASALAPSVHGPAPNETNTEPKKALKQEAHVLPKAQPPEDEHLRAATLNYWTSKLAMGRYVISN